MILLWILYGYFVCQVELKCVDWPVKYVSPIPFEIFIAVIHGTNFKQPIVKSWNYFDGQFTLIKMQIVTH